MSKGSEAVKRWRRNTKQRIIDSMGGRCDHCHYDRCPEALELHHLDPSQKEMNFGSMRANPQAWAKIVLELRKCVLLCSNCHREVHAGLIELVDSTSFNEEFALFSMKDAGPTDGCPVCGKNKPVQYSTCSLDCGRTRKGTIDWSQYDLFEMLTRLSYGEIAEKVGCSNAAVWKRVRKLRKDNENVGV